MKENLIHSHNRTRKSLNSLSHNKDKICSVKSKDCEDADVVIVSYGGPVRSVIEAVARARADALPIPPATVI